MFSFISIARLFAVSDHRHRGRAHPRARARHGSRTTAPQIRWSSNCAPSAHAWAPDHRFHCASRLGGGGSAARTAHARACTTKHAAWHCFAGWCGISGRQRSHRFCWRAGFPRATAPGQTLPFHRFRRDVLQAVHSQLRRLVWRRAAGGESLQALKR